MSHDPIDDGNSAAREQEQHCRLFDLPNELLMEIAAHLCTPDEYGNVCFESIKSFSLVSKRVRRVTTERLPLTVSTRSPFEQLLASQSHLSQIKQLVLKPEPQNTQSSRGSLRINKLLRHMPLLLELNIHVGVPLSGIMRQGQLPTVRTLSVPINQDGPAYETTSIIRACPNVTLLRLNLTGKPIRTGDDDGDGVSRPECRRALEAAAALGSLRALEVFKFGSTQQVLMMQSLSHIFGALGSPCVENGWVPDDLKVLREYFPHISSLALYGNVGLDDSRDNHVRISDLLAECGEITNLNSLTMTTEAIDAWQWIEDDDSPFFGSVETRNQDQDQDELIWSGAGDESCVYPAVGKAFEACANLQEVSFVFGQKGRTWEARGADAAAFKTWDFVNSKYALSATGEDHTQHRWF